MMKFVAICIAVLIAATKAVDESSTKMTRELKVAAQVVANDLDNLVIPLTSDAAEDEGTSVSKKAALRGAFASPDEDEVRSSDTSLVGLDDFLEGFYKISQDAYFAYSSNDCKNVLWEKGSLETKDDEKYKWYFVNGFIISIACMPKVMDITHHKCRIGQSVGLYPIKEDSESNRNQKWHAWKRDTTASGERGVMYTFETKMTFCEMVLNKNGGQTRIIHDASGGDFKLSPTEL